MATFAAPDSLAQLVEHNTFNVGVLGSSPRRITVKPVICRLFCAPGWPVRWPGRTCNIKVLFYFVKTSLFFILQYYFS